jgi:hypothetical protein
MVGGAEAVLAAGRTERVGAARQLAYGNQNKQEMSERPILITPAHFLGLDELYTNFFKCPICKTKSPVNGTSFCRGCGAAVKMSPAVVELAKKTW